MRNINLFILIFCLQDSNAQIMRYIDSSLRMRIIISDNGNFSFRTRSCLSDDVNNGRCDIRGNNIRFLPNYIVLTESLIIQRNEADSSCENIVISFNDGTQLLDSIKVYSGSIQRVVNDFKYSIIQIDNIKTIDSLKLYSRFLDTNILIDRVLLENYNLSYGSFNILTGFSNNYENLPSLFGIINEKELKLGDIILRKLE